MFLHQASGLYLTLNRAYDPYSGRWLSRDPIEEAGGINIYAYIGDDPVNDIDLLGLNVTVTLYQGAGPFDHIGFGVAPAGQSVPADQTYGFYPKPGYSLEGAVFGTPGQLIHDTGRVPISSITIQTTSAQDAAVQQYINNQKAHPGNYSAVSAGGGRNCATTAEGALSGAGISVPKTIYPKDLMQGLQSIYGGVSQ
jgi:RHS repeat-associated protein